MTIVKAARAAMLLVFLPFGVAEAAEIRTTGERIEDGVVSIGTQGGRQVLETASGKKIALENVKEIRFSDRAPSRLREVHLWLLSGEELNGTIGEELRAGDAFELTTPSLGRLEVPLDLVGAMVFDVPAEREERFARRQLGWLLEGKGAPPAHERFALLEGGDGEGRLEHFSRDGLVIHDTKRKVTWPTFPIKRLESLVLSKKPPTRGKGLRALVRLGDGSVVIGPVAKLEEKRLTLAHPLGKKDALTIELAEVLSLEMLGGAFEYLSDLAPSKVDESFPEGFERDADTFGWKRDRAVLGATPLRLGGRTFQKGLGVHTRSALEFPVAGAWRELRATVGLDDSTRWAGTEVDPSVTFRVLVDGKVAKELRKARGEAPEEIAVSVQGARTVTLVADYGDYLHVLGRADWADAHLVK